MPDVPKLLALGGALLVCAFAPLAVGTVHLWSIAVATGLAAAFLGMVIYRRTQVENRPLHVGWVGIAFCVATAWTALQLVPLPPGLIEALSPRAHEILDFSLGPFGLYGEEAWRPVSLDPPSTARELVKLLGLTAAYLGAVNLCVDRAERNTVLAGIAVIGAVLVGIGVVQKVSGTRAILGVYESSAAAGNFFTSTFVNPNHLAGYLLLATPLALATALVEERGAAWRLLFGACGIACAAGVLLTLSRSGIAALAAGGLLFSVLLLRRRGAGARRVLIVAISLAVAAVLAGLTASERLLAELSPARLAEDLQENLKVQLWKDTLPILGDFAGGGIGKGAFPFVFPLYQSNTAQYTFTHPENQLLQVLVDHGVVVGGSLLLVVAARVGRLLVSRLSTIGCGAAAAIAAVALHNLADFNLEVGGVAFAFAVVLGMALGNDATAPMRAPPRPWRVQTVLATLWVAACAAGLAFAAPYARGAAAEAAVARVKGASGDAAAIERAALRELPNHPADYLLFLTAAAKLANDPRRAIRFANRALYLNGASYQTHWVAARLLRAVGAHAQATVEYRLAVRRSPERLERVLADMEAMPNSREAMVKVAESRAERWRLASYLFARGRHGDAARVAAMILEADPRDPDALAISARAALLRGDRARVLALAARLGMISGRAAEAAMLSAEALAAEGRHRDALASYERARSLSPRLPEAYVRAAEIHLSLGETGPARRLLDQLRKVDIYAAAQARVSLLLGRVWELEGKPARAMREYRRILDRDPRHAEATARLKALEK